MPKDALAPTDSPSAALLAQQERQKRLELMTDLEDGIQERCLRVLDGYLAFEEVRPDSQEPPPEWVAKYGVEGAERRLALARVGWMPKQYTPGAFDAAQKFVTGTQKARSEKRVGGTQLNVQMLVFPAPTTREHPGPVVYEVKELEE